MTFDITLLDAGNAPLNARVEADDRGFIVHSRSGKDRNRDYRLAVEMILARLDAARVRYDVYLDSGPVQHLPLVERQLTLNRGDSVAERFNSLVRAMNAGSSSNGAWRRILITAPGYTAAALATLVAGASPPPRWRKRTPASG